MLTVQIASNFTPHCLRGSTFSLCFRGWSVIFLIRRLTSPILPRQEELIAKTPHLLKSSTVAISFQARSSHPRRWIFILSSGQVMQLWVVSWHPDIIASHLSTWVWHFPLKILFHSPGCILGFSKRIWIRNCVHRTSGVTVNRRHSEFYILKSNNRLRVGLANWSASTRIIFNPQWTIKTRKRNHSFG